MLDELPTFGINMTPLTVFGEILNFFVPDWPHMLLICNLANVSNIREFLNLTRA